jgi:hypothetical protein
MRRREGQFGPHEFGDLSGEDQVLGSLRGLMREIAPSAFGSGPRSPLMSQLLSVAKLALSQLQPGDGPEGSREQIYLVRVPTAPSVP